MVYGYLFDYTEPQPRAGLNEIAVRLSLPESTVHGLISTLEHFGRIEQSAFTKLEVCTRIQTPHILWKRSHKSDLGRSLEQLSRAEALLKLDAHAVTPWILKLTPDMKHHHKEGVRIAAGRVGI